MTETKKETVLIRVITDQETVAQSWLKDAFSYLIIVAIIGTGVLLHSSAMQWVGFLMLVIGVFGRIQGKTPKRTPEEAIKFIQEKYLEGKQS